MQVASLANQTISKAVTSKVSAPLRNKAVAILLSVVALTSAKDPPKLPVMRTLSHAQSLVSWSSAADAQPAAELMRDVTLVLFLAMAWARRRDFWAVVRVALERMFLFSYMRTLVILWNLTRKRRFAEELLTVARGSVNRYPKSNRAALSRNLARPPFKTSKRTPVNVSRLRRSGLNLGKQTPSFGFTNRPVGRHLDILLKEYIGHVSDARVQRAMTIALLRALPPVATNVKSPFTPQEVRSTVTFTPKE